MAQTRKIQANKQPQNPIVRDVRPCRVLSGQHDNLGAVFSPNVTSAAVGAKLRSDSVEVALLGRRDLLGES